MNPERVGNRPRAQHESRSPAQITALVMGVWWTTNGIGAFFLDPNLTTSHVSGGGDLFGVAITVNGWHALFHLIPGVLGIVAARHASPALAFTLTAGTLYVVVGVWGLLAGGSSFGVIAIDSSGDIVHVVEGLLALTCDAVVDRSRPPRVHDSTGVWCRPPARGRGPHPASNEAATLIGRGERRCFQRRLQRGYSRFGDARPGRHQIVSG